MTVSGARRTPLPWLAALLLAYLAVPIVAFCVRLATAHDRGFHDPGLFPALVTSVVAASISTAVITACGVPLAYLLARSKSRIAAIAGVAVQLPLAVPPVMGGILLIYIVGPYTVIGRFFDGALTGTLAGVVLAQTFVAAPFLIVTARAAFQSVDPSLEEVAETLGHGQWGRFFAVSVPAAAPGIRAGMVLAWLRAFGEYGATVIVAYHPTSLPVYTFTQFSATGLPGTMAPTALALGVAVVLVGIGRIVLRRWGGRGRGVWFGRHRGFGAVPGTSAHLGATAWASPGVLEPPDMTRSRAGAVSFSLTHRVGEFRLCVAHHGATSRLAVLGPSGSGKSTLLRCIAGLYASAPGAVRYGEQDVSALRARERGVGYVAQGFSLFPHLRVWRQLMFASDADPQAGAYWLARFGLTGLEDRFPDELSGGQRQRVALAQALSRTPPPRVVLLDEPLSGLDTPVRADLRRELRRLQLERGISTVVVTHDPEEAAYLADEVLVIEGGAALQQGSVPDVFGAPVSTEAARLLGVRNAWSGSVRSRGVVTLGGTFFPADTGSSLRGDGIIWSVPPEVVRLAPLGATTGTAGDGSAGAASSAWIEGVVEDVADLGTSVETTVALPGGITLVSRRNGPMVLAPGDRCLVAVPLGAARPPPTLPPPDPLSVGEGPPR